jgi:HNH endonuclease
MAEYVPIGVQRAIIALSKGHCEYCVCPYDYAMDYFNFDHIIPVCQGGTSELKNIARTCGRCNGDKGAKTHGNDPLTQQYCRLYHPREDIWAEHFRWSKDELRIVGKTAIGRTTIESLQLNREGVVNLRKLLIMVGLHPPIL